MYMCYLLFLRHQKIHQEILSPEQGEESVNIFNHIVYIVINIFE